MRLLAVIVLLMLISPGKSQDYLWPTDASRYFCRRGRVHLPHSGVLRRVRKSHLPQIERRKFCHLCPFNGINRPINPLRYYRSMVNDAIPPTVTALAVIPWNGSSFVNFQPDIFIQSVVGKGNVTLAEPIYVTGTVLGKGM